MEPTLTVRDESGRLTGDVRKAIQLAFLKEKVSRVHLAKRYGVDRQSVTRCLTGEDFEALEKAVFEETKRNAIRILNQGSERAAAKWAGTTLDKAAKKGNHKPMEDLLKATGMIQETAQSRIVVQIGVQLTGAPDL